MGRRPVETLFTTLHRHLIMLTERSRHHPPYITYLPYFCRTLWVRSTDLSMAVPIFAFCKSFSSLHYSPSTDKNCEFVYVPACRLVSLYLFFYFFVIILFLSSSAFCHHLTSGFLNLVIIDELQRIILGDQGPGDNAALIYKSRLPLFAQGRVEIMLNNSKELWT